MADQLAQEMIERGVSRGDRVVIFLNNCIEAVISIFGVLKAGAVFVMVNRATKVGKLAYILRDCRGTMLIADDKVHWGQLSRRLKRRIHGFEASLSVVRLKGHSQGDGPPSFGKRL